MTKAIIWSNVGCHFCEMAKTLLTQKGIEYEERNIAKDWKIQDLLEAVPSARTVPQIFLDDKYVCSYDDLVEYLKNDQTKS